MDDGTSQKVSAMELTMLSTSKTNGSAICYILAAYIGWASIKAVAGKDGKGCTPKKSAWRRLLPAVSAIMEEGPWRCTLSKWRRIKTIRASSRRVDSYNSQARRQSEAGDWRCLPLWKAARSLEGRAARKKIRPEVRLNISFHSCVFNNHLLRSPGQI